MLTVLAQTHGDEAGDALVAVNNSAPAPTMAPRPVATAQSARPLLSIVPKEAIVAAVVEQFDKKIDAPHKTPIERGELQEWEDWAAVGVTVFRHVTLLLGLPSIMHLPTRLLTPEVRGKICDLRDAIEREAQAQAKR